MKHLPFSFSFLLLLIFLAPGAFTQTTDAADAANAGNAANAAGPLEKHVVSPDGNLTFDFRLAEDGSLSYSVSWKGQQVVLPSSLGLEGFDKGFQLAKEETRTHDETWKPVYGERAVVRDCYNALTLNLVREKQQPMNLEIRMYNEGAAFRYEFPERNGQGADLKIAQELTDYTFPKGTKAWFTPAAQTRYTLLPLEKWPSECERPLVLQEENGLYVCLTEAQVVNYVRTKFILHPEKPDTVSAKMYGDVELTTPFFTPWRVVMAAEHAKDLLANNDLILNLNPPCEISDTSWIRPGKVMRETTLSTQGAKELVDFAVKHNIQYLHFDAGWYGYEYSAESDATTVTVDPRRNAKGDLDLPEAIRYAKEHGIGVIVYVNQRALYKQLDEILPLYESWGISGIKFGFVHVGSFFWTKWMHDAVKKCADHHLMVDIHDEYRPTGFSRTFPNLMTQEGICGNEEMPTATHNTVLPFTRFTAGAADYTISYYFHKVTPEERKNNPKARGLQTTSAHQLALAAVYYSPFQFMYWYDRPSSANDEPEMEFFDRVSTVWDDTKVLDGEIGEFVVVARKKGDEWFLGTVTNDSARTLNVPLSFLDENQKYEARIFYDDPEVPTKTHVGVRDVPVTRETVLEIPLCAAGGQAVWIHPAK